MPKSFMIEGGRKPASNFTVAGAENECRVRKQNKDQTHTQRNQYPVTHTGAGNGVYRGTIASGIFGSVFGRLVGIGLRTTRNSQTEKYN